MDCLKKALKKVRIRVESFKIITKQLIIIKIG